MINVSSLVEPLGRFPILPYLIQALRAVICEELSEDDQDNLDIWLAHGSQRGQLAPAGAAGVHGW